MENYFYVIQSLLELAPDKQWTFKDEDLSTLEWAENYENVPSIKEIEDRAAELAAK